MELADGQVGILAPAAGGTVHYGPSGGVIASELGSAAAALAVAGAAFLERRRRRRAAGSAGAEQDADGAGGLAGTRVNVIR